MAVKFGHTVHIENFLKVKYISHIPLNCPSVDFQVTPQGEDRVYNDTNRDASTQLLDVHKFYAIIAEEVEKKADQLQMKAS